MLVVPPYILGFLCIMDQNVSNFLIYTHILISQKINFVTEVRFSQKRSHIYIQCIPVTKCSVHWPGCLQKYEIRSLSIVSVLLIVWLGKCASKMVKHGTCMYKLFYSS